MGEEHQSVLQAVVEKAQNCKDNSLLFSSKFIMLFRVVWGKKCPISICEMKLTSSGSLLLQSLGECFPGGQHQKAQTKGPLSQGGVNLRSR